MSVKVAVITGAARRVGAALVRQFHQQGYNVLLHYRHSKTDADQLAAELNALRADSVITLQADLLQSSSIQDIAECVENTWQRCDVLVNNASAFYPRKLADCSEDDWNTLVGSNLKAPFFLIQALAGLLKQHHGSVINIVDISAERAREFYSLYCMAKAGNAMMTQALSLELAPEVRVNGIAPGAILWPENDDGEEVSNPDRLQAIPLKRLGGTQSICETVDFLIHSASYITGEIIKVDGGQSVK